MEVTDVLNIVPWLLEIECDYVVFTGNRILADVRKNLRDKLKLAGIRIDPESKWLYNSKDKDFYHYNYNLPVVIRFRTSRDPSLDEPAKAGKIVQLVNSQPIDIK